MAKMKVYNDNTHPYREIFKGDKIEIPSKGFIIMDYDDAYQFRGTFSPPVLNADNQHMPEGFKMIRVVKHDEDEAVEPKAETFGCIACKYKGGSAVDVAEHTKAAHSADLVVDKLAEEALKTRKRAS